MIYRDNIAKNKILFLSLDYIMLFLLYHIKEKINQKGDITHKMNWLRTAASAYSNVSSDPEWPKYDILETTKVLYIYIQFLI